MIYLKIESGNEARNKKFSNFKARNKVCIKHFKVKITEVCDMLVSEGDLGLVEIIKPTKYVMLIGLEAKHHRYKFHR